MPTGAGKTLAAVLPWVYRRRLAVDEVRSATPPWLVFVLPMRVLVEQTQDAIQGWLSNLRLADDVACHTLLGGEPRTASWRARVGQDTIIVGTLDMIVSRALNRGYGESRSLGPIDFGLLNAGCHFVFDEVQLMGPALATSRQLHGLRASLGTGLGCTGMWMSATVPEAELATVDAPAIASRVELSDIDLVGPLRDRAHAAKTVNQLVVESGTKYADVIASCLMGSHRNGTLTISVLNTVDRARQVFDAVRRLTPSADIVLLHSRFRPPERRRQMERVLSPIDESGPGRIVVSTQVIEAGVDLSAHLLLTELAPWPSVVQRAGRCNRDGHADAARFVWVEPPAPAPYPAADLDASRIALVELDGRGVTPVELREADVEVTEEIQPVPRCAATVGTRDVPCPCRAARRHAPRLRSVVRGWRSVQVGGAAGRRLAAYRRGAATGSPTSRSWTPDRRRSQDRRRRGGASIGSTSARLDGCQPAVAVYIPAAVSRTSTIPGRTAAAVTGANRAAR